MERTINAKVPDKLRVLARSVPLAQLSRYTQLAVVSAGINLILPVVLHETGAMSAAAAVAVSLACAFLFNFTVARIYVFRASGKVAPQMLRFALTSGAARVAEYVAFRLLHSVLGWHYLVAITLVLAISFGLKFGFYRRYVFTSRRDGADR